MTKQKARRKVKRPARPRQAVKIAAAFIAHWPIPVAAALGSSVRLAGIEREIRAKLPWLSRNYLTVENGRAVLGMPEGETAEFEDASRIVAGVMDGIESLPILPSEVEDILTITAHERQKWLKDSRLKSAGTRTVKLRGRAKAVTFHVFDPRDIEDALDRDLPTIWREHDTHATAENRKRAAGKAALKRAGKGSETGTTPLPGKERDRDPMPKLAGWETFAIEGLLR